ncbi:rubredoxin [Synechococcus sp. PCC 7502]|uniref:rubredoxin n=1 Tax=Synechococcus sp. PCC 7502 TaxID=1173263 RepID=UPI00029FCB5E|nr:rubredoxin [Synechococcus sp. PCC 7502]AFY73140.1 rubredoxin [Synechococcus sp. PCC 7502]
MEPEINNSEQSIQEINPPSPVLLEPVVAIEEPHRYECGSCGYVYEPTSGDPKRGIIPGTLFTDLPADWRCPVCTSRPAVFSDIGIPSKPSGFTENLGYGFGVNVMTPSQKNLLIFGSLAVAFAFFMSLYALD